MTGTTLAALTLLALPVSVQAAQISPPEVLVMSDDPAPGTNPPANFWGFTGAANVACNADGPSPWLVGGHVVISGCAGGSAWTGYWGYSLADDQLLPATLTGEPTPGVPFTDLVFLPNDVRFARTEIETFGVQGTADGDGSSSSTDEGIWQSDAAGMLELLAREGINAPGPGSPPDVLNGTRYAAFNWFRPLVADGGVLAFVKAIEGAEDGWAIWGSDPAGDLSLRVLEDEPTPQRGGGSITFTSLFASILHAMNDAGDVLFSGSTATENNIFLSHADGTVSVPPGSRLSDLPAGSPAGPFAYRRLPPYYLDDQEGLHSIGQFNASMEGVVVPDAAGMPTVVLLEGSVAPGGNGNEAVETLRTESLNYGASGHSAVTAELVDTVTDELRFSIWLIAPDASADYVVGEGDAVAIANPGDLPANTPGAPNGGWVYDSLRCGFWCGGDLHPIPDGVGGVLFGAELSEGLQSTRFSALFHEDAQGEVRLVIKEGEQISLGAESAPLVRPLFSEVAYPAAPMNEHGLVFRATLFPPSGVTEAIVFLPEPAGGLVVAFLAVLGLRWRTRSRPVPEVGSRNHLNRPR